MLITLTPATQLLFPGKTAKAWKEGQSLQYLSKPTSEGISAQASRRWFRAFLQTTIPTQTALRVIDILGL